MKEHWLQAKALFAEAIELAPEERGVLIESADVAPEAREQASAMLRSFEADETKFLQRPGSSMGPEATPLPPEAPAIRRLGDVRIDGVIGRGAMGYVLSGHDERLDRPVAVKCLPATSSMTEEQTARFETEARSIAQLNHPSIVTVYGVEASGDDSFIVMAHLAGPNLREELETLRGGGPGGRLPEFGQPGYTGAAVDLVRQIAEALAHAHDQGVIHRDVKPANLIFDEFGRLVLVDFGLARIAGTASMTMDSDVRGTVHYMSPEQARLLSDNTVDARTDVYALGCVLYELLTLEKPYPGDEFREVFAAKSAGPPRAPRSLQRSLPRDLETICLVAMSRLPGDRYASAGDFAEDLARFLDHRSILAAPPGFPVRAARWIARHRARLAAAALLVLVTVAGTLWLAEQQRLAGLPLVDVVVEGGEAELLEEARVSWAAVDGTTGAVGPATALGRLADAPFRIPGGAGRARIDDGRDQFFEVGFVVAEGLESQTMTLSAPGPVDTSGMIAVAGGAFDDLPEFDPSKFPLLAGVTVGDFLIDAREVTHGEFFKFAQEHPEYWSGWWAFSHLLEEVEDDVYRLRPHAVLPEELVDLPVTAVSFESAEAYAAWRGCRLPTLYEANMASAALYDRFGPGKTPAFDDRTIQDPTGGGVFRRAGGVEADRLPSGIVDLLGSAREWTRTPVRGGMVLDLSKAYLVGTVGPPPSTAAGWPLVHVPGDLNPKTADGTYGFRCARSN